MKYFIIMFILSGCSSQNLNNDNLELSFNKFTASGSHGSTEDGELFNIENGIFVFLYKIDKNNVYLCFERKKIFNEILLNHKYLEIKNGKIHKKGMEIYSGEISISYKTLKTTQFPQKTIVKVEKGIIVQVLECDTNNNMIESFNIKKNIERYKEYGIFSETYLTDSSFYYCPFGAPAHIVPIECPYIKICDYSEEFHQFLFKDRYQ